MKLSELALIPLRDWRLKDFQEAEPDVPYTIRRYGCGEHHFVLGIGVPEHYYCSAGFGLEFNFGLFGIMIVLFNFLGDLPKWAQDKWREVEDSRCPRPDSSGGRVSVFSIQHIGESDGR